VRDTVCLPTNLYAIVKEQYLVSGIRYRGSVNAFAFTGPRSQVPGPKIGGGERVRTDDPLRARQVLSQLSYTPDKSGMKDEL
jgi:hypothetical protein